jgi:hypothetical protein
VVATPTIRLHNSQIRRLNSPIFITDGESSHHSLAELLAWWSPEEEAKLATLLRRLAKQLL